MHTITSPVSNQETEYLRSQSSPPKFVTCSFLTPFSFNNFSRAVSVKSSLALSQQ